MKTMSMSLKRTFAFASLTLCLLWSCENEAISARESSEALFMLKVNKIVDKPDLY